MLGCLVQVFHDNTRGPAQITAEAAGGAAPITIVYDALSGGGVALLAARRQNIRV